MRRDDAGVVPWDDAVRDSVVAAPPLDGWTVVELGRFASAPSCATLLADWGATVIKIEPPEGDPARGPGSVAAGVVANPRFDLHNRSRRSVALDLTRPGPVAAAHRLIGAADVFLTNLRPSVLARLQMDAPTLCEVNPRLVYGQITGYGLDHDRADVRSFDHGAFWSYSGVADLFAGPDGEPPQPAGGLGDRASGALLAAGVLAALLRRTTTGQGDHVATSLLSTGTWLAASEVSDALLAGSRRANDRRQPLIPTLNCFRTVDGRWLWLQVMHPARDWPALLGALDAAWLDDDPRFRGGAVPRAAGPVAALVEALDEIFAQRSLTEWGERLDGAGLTWAPVRSVDDMVRDATARGGAFRTIRRPDGHEYQAVDTPCSFASWRSTTGVAAPAVGEHTADVLGALGYSADEIAEFVPAEPTAARPVPVPVESS